MAHLGICSNNAAELQAIRYRLELAWRYGYRRVVCEVDARLVLDFVATAETDIHPCGGLIEDFRELLKKGWKCRLQHTLREGNFVADLLSKGGIVHTLGSACFMRW